MKRKVHVVLGASLGASIPAVMGASSLDRLLGLLFGALGGYIPDLDLRRQHRVLLHNVLSAIVFALTATLAVGVFSNNWSLAACAGLAYLAGHISHIVADMFTERGVALLYPWSTRRYRLARFRSDNEVLNSLFALLAALLALLAIKG
ncbi:MAG TPA: metal-dependent hydrolase [Pyrodictium sp.]|nr:metal-dependent hydrolase [Pyrodictium sp.]